MNYQPGMVLWSIPIRYWEESEPERVVVREPLAGGGLIVHHNGYGHDVYMAAKGLYYDSANARKVIEALTIIYNTRLDDDASYMVDDILNEIPKEAIR